MDIPHGAAALSAKPTGYQMIRSAQVKNFRCFRDIKVPDLRRVNVIVGRNASGKTALLEALFLAAGPSPEIALRLKGWRGYDAGTAAGTFAQIDESVWGDLFFGYDRNNTVEIGFEGSDNHTRGLRISYGEVDEIFQAFGDEKPTVSISAVEFVWTRYDGQQFRVRPAFTRGGYAFPGAEHAAVQATFFASSHPFINQENLARFTNLSKRRKEQTFVKAVSKEFDFIKNIDIQSYLGQSMLYADVVGLPEKVPLVAISSGVNKLASIFLALASFDTKIVFVDEIENGIHHSRLESTWKSIADLAVANDAQLFASTHSGECLDALARVFEDRPDEMTLIRADSEGGVSFIEQFRGETAIKGIKAGEVR